MKKDPFVVPAAPLRERVRRLTTYLEEAPDGGPLSRARGGTKQFARFYVDRFGGTEAAAERLLSRLLAGQKWLTLAIADRLCILTGTSLPALYGPALYGEPIPRWMVGGATARTLKVSA